MNAMTKEDAYDEKIAPLMEQIIAVCKEHEIPMLADFLLDADDGLKCTTALLDDDWGPTDELIEAFEILKPRPTRSALIVKTMNAKGEVTKIDAIL